METISPPQASPTSSISPPVTPFSIALPYALPPLKTLPTWNRNKFKDKLVRSVPKNKNIKVELIGHIENCTQTSPAFTSTEPLSSPKTPCRKSANHNNSISNLKKSYDKKISFLESTHKEVLTNLHRELERMKIENKALKFKLVMAGEGSATFDDANYKKELDRNKILKSEIKELKNLLNGADSKNIHLSKLVETLKGSNMEKKLNHSGTLKTKLISTYMSDQPILSNSTTEDRDLSAEIVLKQRLDIDVCGNPIHEDNTILPEEKRQKSNTECSVIFPKLEHPNRTTHVLISTSAKRGEPISLPMLQGLPGNRNMSLRQKRARALHVQRQRSNKNVTLSATTAVIKNE